jgi:hypothetical protein
MNLSLIKNKFILTILLAVFFQLNNFMLTQWLIEIDDSLQSKNYEITVNEFKLRDLHNNTSDVIPDLIKLSETFEMNSNLYKKYYYNDIEEYKKKFYPILQHLKFYLIYMKKDFFLESNNNFSNKLDNIEKDFNDLKNEKMAVQLDFLKQKLYEARNNLFDMEKVIYNRNKELIVHKLNTESNRYLINIGLVITQILNLLCLSLFFFFFFSKNSENKKVET